MSDEKTSPCPLVRISLTEWRHIADLTAGDIKRSGLFIHSSHELRLGTKVSVELKLPDGAALTVGGMIVPVGAIEKGRLETVTGFAIRFDASQASDLMVLEAMAATYAGDADVPMSADGITMMPALLILADGTQQMTSAHRTALQPDVWQGRSPSSLQRMIVDAKGAVEVPSAPEPIQASETSPFEIDVDLSHVSQEPTGLDESRTTAEHGIFAAKTAQMDVVPRDVEDPSAVEVDPAQAVFGIDFGSSFSRIAALNRQQKAIVLADEEGQTLVPSVVHYPKDGDPEVGWNARLRLATEPATTVAAAKRLLGVRRDDRSVQSLLAEMRVPTITGPGGQIVADVRGRAVAIPQVAAMIFRHLAKVGEQATGVPVKRVVIGAPVAFGDDQRNALKRAAELADLEVEALVHEPFAAAVAYGIQAEEDQSIAVYDFGGGTFDFTLARVMEGRFKVVAEAGDSWLGGQDFDLKMANYAADQFEGERKVDLRKRQVEWQQLLLLCERCKHQLSGGYRADLVARGMMRTVKGPVDLEVPFTRPIFIKLCGELVDRSLEVVDRCIKEGGLNPAEIDQVVMTGGVSRIPLVRERVQRYFQRRVGMTVSPEQAVVIGNTLYGQMLATATT